MQLSIGAVIWLSVRPLISRLWMNAAFGFILTKLDMFSLEASKTVGQVILNVAMPCLMFSKIVPAFTPDNIDNLGVLVVIAVIYQLLGLLMAWITKRCFWLPHRFRYGILFAGTMSNYSDIPTAVITSITANSPFNGSTDPTLSVAFISGFILVFFISIFPAGGHRLIEMDYKGPNVEDDDLRMSCKKKIFQNVDPILRKIRARRVVPKPTVTEDVEKNIRAEKVVRIATPTDIVAEPRVQLPEEESTAGIGIFHAEASTVVPSEFASPPPTREQSPTFPTKSPPPSTSATIKHRFAPILRASFKSLLHPCSVTIIASIIISVVEPLKALFTPVTSSSIHIPNAPDGQPPLFFIIDCASFVGASSVPLGLLCLGSSIARMSIPHRGEWSRLPLGAIVCLSSLKMVLVPILGVLIVEGFVKSGFIAAEDKVLRFVCMFQAAVPTATVQVYLTQVYSGTGEAGVIPLFLLLQYIMMFFSMTILTAYSLSILF